MIKAAIIAATALETLGVAFLGPPAVAAARTAIAIRVTAAAGTTGTAAGRTGPIGMNIGTATGQISVM